MPSVKVKFPDEIGGTATVNIREGETPQDAIDRRMSNIKAQGKSSGVSDSDWENFWAGMGQGMTNVGRQLGNIAGMEGFSDEELAEKRGMDAPLLDTKAGFTGSMLGEAAVSAPIGMGAGAIAAKALPNAMKMANLGRQAMLQGATEGAIIGGPDNRLGGAALGAGLGGAITKGGQGLMRTMGLGGAAHRAAAKAAEEAGEQAPRVPGMLGNITEKADALQDEIGGAFIPLSQAMPEGSTSRLFYEGIASNLPLSGKRIRGQRTRVVKEHIEEAAEQSLPPSSIPGQQQLRFTADTPMDEVMGSLKSAWDESWDLVKGYDVQVPAQFKSLPESTQKLLREYDFKWPKAGETIKSDDLINLRNDLQRAANIQAGPFSKTAKSRIVAARNEVDGMLDTFFGKGDFEAPKAWRGLTSDEGNSAFNKFLDLEKAAPGNVARKITPAGMEGASAQRAGREGIAGQGALQGYGQRGAEVLTDFPSKQGIFQIAAASGIMAQLAAIPSLALTPVIGRQGMQEFLTAQKGGQAAVTAFLKKYAPALNAAGLLGRGAAVSGAVPE